MLQCQCGYTCGTKAAFERHLQKVDADASAGGHGLVASPPPPAAASGSASSKRASSKESDDYDGSCSRKPKPTVAVAPVRVKGVTAAADTSPGLAASAGLGRMVHAGGATTAPAKSLAAQLQMIQREEELGVSGGNKGGLTKSLSRNLGSSANSMVKVVLVRHAKSGNKEREQGQKASADPDPSDLGFVQADALAERLRVDYGRRTDRLVFASSPMRRCLLTILPTVQQMGGDAEACLCHGGLYEFGGAGKAFAGSHWADIKHEFPHFRPVHFNRDGYWDYRGSSHEESQEEFVDRVYRLVGWINETAEDMRANGPRVGRKIILLCVHQTLADLITRIFIDGSHSGWIYGEIKYKIQNAGLTELHLEGDGNAAFGLRNAGSHLLGVKKDSVGARSRRYHTPVPGTLRATLKERFRSLDKNGDNQLTFDEMAALLRRGDPSMTDRDLKLLFNSCDRNSNELVDFDEFTSFIFSSPVNHDMVVEQL